MQNNMIGGVSKNYWEFRFHGSNLEGYPLLGIRKPHAMRMGAWTPECSLLLLALTQTSESKCNSRKAGR